MSTSFPFLSIARRFNVPYADVLRYAAVLELMDDETLRACPVRKTEEVAICAAVLEERHRRKRIEWP